MNQSTLPTHSAEVVATTIYKIDSMDPNRPLGDLSTDFVNLQKYFITSFGIEPDTGIQSIRVTGPKPGSVKQGRTLLEFCGDICGDSVQLGNCLITDLRDGTVAELFGFHYSSMIDPKDPRFRALYVALGVGDLIYFLVCGIVRDMYISTHFGNRLTDNLYTKEGIICTVKELFPRRWSKLQKTCELDSTVVSDIFSDLHSLLDQGQEFADFTGFNPYVYEPPVSI